MGLGKLHQLLVLQEFVNPGGVIYKVYVSGDHNTCVKCRSLPDVPDDDTSAQGSISFSYILDLPTIDDDLAIGDVNKEPVEVLVHPVIGDPCSP
jgi:inositol-1,3,4-trisphosphate 5/6-kinase / inositol-tetrakisphosphate 1-kinase